MTHQYVTITIAHGKNTRELSKDTLSLRNFDLKRRLSSIDVLREYFPLFYLMK